MNRVAVLGSHGFVGTAVVAALEERSCAVRQVAAPRLALSQQEARSYWQYESNHKRELQETLQDCSVVVNCAGNPDASSRDARILFGANGALPGLIAAAAKQAGATRFVHVSSAVVQGAKETLDESLYYDARSLYAQSKAVGEHTALEASDDITVVYRPPSVHGRGRRITRRLTTFARSPFSTVVGPGSQPTPQAHLLSVADAIAHLATTASHPPRVVIHPWEGWTTASFLELLGEKPPRRLPSKLSRPLNLSLSMMQRSSRVAPNARRLQMLWLGQRQAHSWLAKDGWEAPADTAAWRALVSDGDYNEE